MKKLIFILLISCGTQQSLQPDASLPTCCSIGAPEELLCTEKGICTYMGKECTRYQLDNSCTYNDAGIPND
jgi:hypothetical protein